MPDTFHHLATRVAEVADLLTRAQSDLPNWWKGPAADQAAATLRRAATEAQDFQDSALAAATAVSRCATIVAEQQHQMANIPELPDPGVTAVIDRPATSMEALEAARQDAAYQSAREQAVQVVNGIAAQYVETRSQLAASTSLRGENFAEENQTQFSTLNPRVESNQAPTDRVTRSNSPQARNTPPPSAKYEAEENRKPNSSTLIASTPMTLKQAKEYLKVESFTNVNSGIAGLKVGSERGSHLDPAFSHPGAPEEQTTQVTSFTVEQGSQWSNRNPSHTLSKSEIDSHPGEQTPREVGLDPTKEVHKESSPDGMYASTQQHESYTHEGWPIYSTVTPEPGPHYNYSPNNSTAVSSPSGPAESINKMTVDGRGIRQPTDMTPTASYLSSGQSDHAAAAIGAQSTSRHRVVKIDAQQEPGMIPPSFGVIGSAGHGRGNRNPRPAYLTERKSVWVSETIAAPADGILTPDWFKRS
ncbi:hypothetical protein [Catenulispora yoronensis]